MEKRALLAVILSIIVLGVWQVMVAPPGSPPRPAGEAAPAMPGAGEAAAVEAPPSPSADGGYQSDPNGLERRPASASAVGAEERREFLVETSAYSLYFDNAGGRIVWWKLLQYTDDSKAPLNLIPAEIPPGGEFPLRLAVPGDADATEALDRALFLGEVRDVQLGAEWPGDGFRGKIVTFTWADGSGLEATKRLAVPDEGYMGKVAAEVRKNGRLVPVRLTWAVGLPEPQDGSTKLYWRSEGQGVAHVGTEVRRFKPDEAEAVVQIPGQQAGAIAWGGLESTYFASLLLPEDPATAVISFAPVALIPGPGEEPDTENQLLAARFESQGEVDMVTFVGPKDYDLLTYMGRGLERAIDFSRFSLLYVLSKYLFLALRWIHGYVGNYGVAIILLTIVLRVGFFPLMYRSSISMRKNAKKMQKIQPRVKAIQERYRKMKRTVESQRKMNDEVMAVYKKEGMNPMGSLGGCLPLFIQMPFFLAFYNLLSVTIEMRGAPFVFWVQDLSRMDPYWVLPILMGVSWMGQQAMTSSSIPDPMQRRIMGLMPIMFTWMMLNMPSGLVLYWLMSNVLGLGQQWIINRQADKEPATA
jgi:YidC/Oxa1 family membrane protein insertase